jgi:hypothetical protein
VNGPSWFSQPFHPEGSSLAEGIRNQLGRPRLDLLTILIRESAQNSWDARIRDRDEPVDFHLDLRTIGPAHAGAWRELLQRNAPLDEHLPLRESMRRSTIRVMTVSDRGTNGLGGPTRADSAVTKNHDFVSFVRNIGEPRDTELGGGTYGFGKGIFYLVSRPGTILLHTRCRVDDGHETRLIGCALWKSYVATDANGETRYTGRHWWGDTSGDVVEPLVGVKAESMAHRLGLSPFGPNETGTTVVVIDPNLEDREPAEAATYLAETITWHLWPKMLDGPSGVPPMRFSVTCDGMVHPVPDPRETHPLDMFVAAYRRLDDGESRSLECLSPRKLLGRLGLEKKYATALEPTSAARMVGIESLVHHVCLMRPAELVVTYHPGPKPPSELIAYAGVFRADRALDETYAKAEPPTHDSWNHETLEHPESRYVRTTFRRISEALEGLLDLGGKVRAGSAQIALGAASGRFAPLVGGAWGIGGATDYGKPGDVRLAPRPTTTPPSGTSEVLHDADAVGGRSTTTRYDGPGGGSGGDGHLAGSDLAGGSAPVSRPTRRRPRVEYVGDPYLDERSDAAVIVQRFRLPVPGPQRVRVDLAVALTGPGGRETDPPLEAKMPGLLGWENAAGDLLVGPTYVIEGGDDTVWSAIVLPAPDTMTEITVLTQAVEGGGTA